MMLHIDPVVCLLLLWVIFLLSHQGKSEGPDVVEKEAAKLSTPLKETFFENIVDSLTILDKDGSIIGFRSSQHPDVKEIREGKHEGLRIKEDSLNG